MRLREEELGIKVAYRGQELYSHVAFANEAARLANEIGDINGFLLPTVRNQLPEAIRNTLKGLGKKPKTWEDFRKAMTAIQLSDLREEAAEITKEMVSMPKSQQCAYARLDTHQASQEQLHNRDRQQPGPKTGYRRLKQP